MQWLEPIVVHGARDASAELLAGVGREYRTCLQALRVASGAEEPTP
jgi:hypothetical protein